MATLFSRIHGVTVRKNKVDEIVGLKKAIDMLIGGSEILDLTHASDIITPSLSDNGNWKWWKNHRVCTCQGEGK